MPELRQLHGVFLIAKTAFGRRPLIVVTLSGRESSALVRKAKRLGAKVLELRIDRFPRLEEKPLLKKVQSYRSLGLPLIATIRSRGEGGGRTIPEAERLALFQFLLPFVEAVDIELASRRLVKVLVPLAHRKKKIVILSYHNFRSTPPDAAMKGVLERARRMKADLVKIAVTPKRAGDLGRLLLFTRRFRDRGLVTIPMGEKGKPGRLLAPLFGSRLAYTFIGRPQAPGQLSLKKFTAALI